MDGKPVATIAEPRTNKFTLSYEPAAERTVSARLPWSDERYPPAATAPWIDSIVPPLADRERMAEELDVPAHLLFRFLEAGGADLPGAIVIEAPVGQDTARPRPLTSSDITDDVGGDIAVVAHNGSWARPALGSPSSHVLRIEDDLLPGSAAAEIFALTLAREAGVPTVDAEQTEVLGRPAVVVARPDRNVTADGFIGRVHLETFGSLCGVTLEGDDDRIYEERGGPGFSELAEAIDAFAADPQAAVRLLVRHMVIHFCTGNTNAHANSFTLLHPSRELGPIHTLLPAEIYTELVTEEGTFDIDHRLAMTIGGQAVSADVTHGALVAEAASWPRLGRSAAEAAVNDALERVEAARAVAAAAISAPERLPALVSDRLGRLMQ